MRSNPTTVPRVLIVMGVSGSGKTEVGQRLAAKLTGHFFDADAFHPPENIAKMSQGVPLTDADRIPWLEAMRTRVIDACPPGETCVLACSALKRHYREYLRATRPASVHFIFLDGSYDIIFARMQERTDHFMREEMLRSQFASLEAPGNEEAIQVSIAAPVDEVVTRALENLKIGDQR